MLGLAIFIILAIGGACATALSLKYGPYQTYEEAAPPAPPPQPPMPPKPTAQEQLYTFAHGLIGQHLTLNEAVPWMVGCAEAISNILYRFDIPGIPVKGIEGTAALLAFLESSHAFTEITDYESGAIIISATGTGNGKIRGHVGICGHAQIMSNNSETGKWDTTWSIAGPASVGQNWTAYYHEYGGIPTRFFRPV